MLKVVGFSRIQLGRLVLLETGIAGLFAGIVAVPMGVVLSLALIKVINVRSFGWSMQFDLAPELMAKSVLLALLAALAGGLYPAWRMARQHLPTGLRHE